VILIGGIWFLQESPRRLMEKDRHADALAAFQKLHGDGTPERTGYIQLEYQEIRDVIAVEREHNKISWFSIF